MRPARIFGQEAGQRVGNQCHYMRFFVAVHTLLASAPPIICWDLMASRHVVAVWSFLGVDF